MATVAAVAAVAAVGVQIAGTVLQARAQSRAARAQQQQRTLAANRRRREAVRNARIARGAVVNTSALTGTAGSAGEAGALGSISSQLASNLSFLDTSVGLGNEIASQQGQANIFGSISRIGQSIFNIAGGTSAIARAVTPPAPIAFSPLGPR